MSTGVLAMAYGTPAGSAQVEAYYTHIRRGHAPSPEQLAELKQRYAAIGGVSPLHDITLSQVGQLRSALSRAGRGDIPVALGFKHAPPFIEDAVEQLADSGVERIIGVVLAPHYSELSIGEYAARARLAAASVKPSPALSVVRHWHLAPPYLELLAGAVTDALARLPLAARGGAHVLFTAHSLPERILADGDPYPDQLHSTAAAVAELAGLTRWSVAWQSAGRTPEPWIGPDVLQAIGELAVAGVPAVVVCPAGFVSDHLEILYDLDIEARERAAELEIEFARTVSPNAAPQLAEALAAAVLGELEGAHR